MESRILCPLAFLRKGEGTEIRSLKDNRKTYLKGPQKVTKQAQNKRPKFATILSPANWGSCYSVKSSFGICKLLQVNGSS